MTCWAHFIRNFRKAVKSSPNATLLISQLHCIHKAPTKQTFDALIKQAIIEWNGLGETVTVNWLKREYFNDNWNGWWIGASAISGSPFTTNYQESYNSALKSASIIPNTTSFGNFLSIKCQRILSYSESLLEKQKIPFIRDVLNQKELINSRSYFSIPMLEKAKMIIDGKNDHVIKRSDANSVTYYISTKEEIEHFRTITDLKVDNFISVKNEYSNFNDCKFQLLSMHRVNRTEDIFVCDCKMYMFTGYICSHVLASYHFDKLLNVYHLLKPLQLGNMRAGAGRREKRSLALVNDSEKQIAKRICGTFINHETFGIGTIQSHQSKKNTFTVYFEKDDFKMKMPYADVVKYARERHDRIHKVDNESVQDGDDGDGESAEDGDDESVQDGDDGVESTK